MWGLVVFNAKTKNMAWDIFRHDFQSRGRTIEHQIACFFMSKQALTLQFILSKIALNSPE